MYYKEIGQLLNYMEGNCEEPKLWWSKHRLKEHSIESYAYESAINRCMNNPTKDPKDILEEYLISIAFSIAYFQSNKNYKRQKEYMLIESIVSMLMFEVLEGGNGNEH